MLLSFLRLVISLGFLTGYWLLVPGDGHVAPVCIVGAYRVWVVGRREAVGAR